MVYVTDRELTLAENETLPDSYQIFTLRSNSASDNYIHYEVPNSVKKQLSEALLETCLAYGDKVIEGKSVREWLQFDQANIFHYHKFRIFYTLRNLAYDLAAITQLAEAHPSITFFTKQAILTRLDGLPSNVRVVYRSAPSSPVNYLNLIHFGGLLLLRWWRNLGLSRNIRNAKYLIINRPNQEVTMVFPPNMKLKKENPYYGYLFSHAETYACILEEFDHPKLRDTTPFRINTRLITPRKEVRHLYGDSILLNSLLKSSVRNEVRSATQQLSQRYDLLAENTSTIYEQAIVKLLRGFHSASRYYLFRFFSYKAFFSKNPIQRILTQDEGSPTIKSILDAAKSCGIKTLGLQHGSIPPHHVTYRFTPDDILNANPIPDTTLVWGTYWKEVLTTYGHYPSERVQIVGQPRTDIIPLLKGLNKRAVISDLDEKRPLVVFASQLQPDPSMRERAARDVFRAAAKDPSYQLVVKLHPRERDLSYYAAIADEEDCKDYLQIAQVDLYCLLAVCDILITCYSTVGGEAVYFYKPLIILDHLQQDMMGYISEGVGLEATNAATLADQIKRVLTGNSSIDRNAYDQFIQKYAYRVDGKASLRVWEALSTSEKKHSVD